MDGGEEGAWDVMDGWVGGWELSTSLPPEGWEGGGATTKQVPGTAKRRRSVERGVLPAKERCVVDWVWKEEMSSHTRPLGGVGGWVGEKVLG